MEGTIIKIHSSIPGYGMRLYRTNSLKTALILSLANIDWRDGNHNATTIFSAILRVEKISKAKVVTEINRKELKAFIKKEFKIVISKDTYEI